MKEMIRSGSQRMTSLEIAEVTGKPHNDVMKAIRKMEEAWVKVQAGNFSLLQKTYQLPNGGSKLQPYYSLTKTETLYVATKFNDEARARLVLRWEQLEREHLKGVATRRLLIEDSDVMREAEKIVTHTLQRNHDNADGCLTATDIAKAMGMETRDLNAVLCDLGLQRWKGGRYRLTPEYEGRGLAQDRLFIYYAKDGKQRERSYLVWTQKGAEEIRRTLNIED